mmetsp:Transcript_41860/g.96857  ORF Transcript_41860/g.96857 Transcript_41860/m.96857 type:complete len:125 (+) Transcript_41860:81-455(+)
MMLVQAFYANSANVQYTRGRDGLVIGAKARAMVVGCQMMFMHELGECAPENAPVVETIHVDFQRIQSEAQQKTLLLETKVAALEGKELERESMAVRARARTVIDERAASEAVQPAAAAGSASGP